MVKRTLELYDCDKCGNEGQRYSITFANEGTLVMDRCPTHARKLDALKQEQGEWVTPATMGRNAFRKTSLAELRLAVAEGRDKDSGGGQSPKDGRK